MSDTLEQVVRREVYHLVCRERDDEAAAVIRTYGDQRDADARSEGHAEGYAQAVADVVKWLEDGGDVVAASYIEQRFGKDQDHG